jgi:hypothetical protein
MILIKKRSAWRYDTFASVGIGVGLVAAEGGSLSFLDPRNTRQQFRYGGVGAGFAWALKIPKLPKLQIRGNSTGSVVGPSTFPNAGALLVTTNCATDDLSRSDFQGPCAFMNGGLGLIAGASAGIMALGLNPVAVAAAIASPFAAQVLWPNAIRSARAILFFGGVNVGGQAGVAAAGYLGAVV